MSEKTKKEDTSKVGFGEMTGDTGGSVSTDKDDSAKPVSKGKGGVFKYLFFGCIFLLLLCCLVLCGSMIFAPRLVSQAVSSTTAERDPDLTHIEPTETEDLKESVDSKNNTRDEKVKEVGDGQYEVTFTEKEVLYVILDSLNLQDNPEEVGIDIEENSMVLEIGLGAVAEQAAKESDNSPVNVDLVKDLYFRVELSNSPDGTQINLDNISTGNSFLDKFLPNSMKVDIEDSINDGLNSESDSVELQKVEFKKDAVVFTYKEKAINS